MITSMTGFAARTGAGEGHRWAWEIRSVNGRGLDLRLRVPDWIAGLEQALRAEITAATGRGTVNLTLRVSREAEPGTLALDGVALDAALDALEEAEARALERGMQLAPTTAGAVLALRGVMVEAGSLAGDEDTNALGKALIADAKPLIAAFTEMRRSEGAALRGVLAETLDRIAALAADARALGPVRRADMEAAFAAALTRAASGSTVEPDRLAQEIALIAVKADVAEELDRLDAHVTAARALLDDAAPVGRKLDFLSQEFNREANTLCSKAQHGALTAIGLELKVEIDRLREQVQNVE